MHVRPFETGDAILAPDPFHDDDPSLVEGGIRPWVIVSTDAFPVQGTDYLACALTSNPSPGPGRIPLAAADWEKGSSRKASQIDSTTLISLRHDWISGYVGRIAHAKVNRARHLVKSYM